MCGDELDPIIASRFPAIILQAADEVLVLGPGRRVVVAPMTDEENAHSGQGPCTFLYRRRRPTNVEDETIGHQTRQPPWGALVHSCGASNRAADATSRWMNGDFA